MKRSQTGEAVDLEELIPASLILNVLFARLCNLLLSNQAIDALLSATCGIIYYLDSSRCCIYSDSLLQREVKFITKKA